MKINRSSKLHFYRWLNKSKQEKIQNIINEYSRVCNYIINKYLYTNKSKFDLLYKDVINEIKIKTETYFTSRMLQEVISEAYGMIKSYQSNKKNNEKHQIPVHTGKKICLSSKIVNIQSSNTKMFDLNIHLNSIGNKEYNINIPLKKNRVYNKWNEIGKLSKSIILTNKYVQVIFEVETGTKKEANGNYLGVDIGMNKLVATSNNNFIGENIKQKLNELQLKKRCSKAYYRKKQEIKEYINYSLKQIDWSSISLLVCEKLKGVKYKMKVKRRLTKNIRRVISNWNYRFILDRLQSICEETNVSFRSILPFYTSQECSSCGHRDKRNRLSQESFCCLNCGHSDNADINASKVILNRFLTGKYGSCFQI